MPDAILATPGISEAGEQDSGIVTASLVMKTQPAAAKSGSLEANRNRRHKAIAAFALDYAH